MGENNNMEGLTSINQLCKLPENDLSDTTLKMFNKLKKKNNDSTGYQQQSKKVSTS